MSNLTTTLVSRNYAIWLIQKLPKNDPFRLHVLSIISKDQSEMVFIDMSLDDR